MTWTPIAASQTDEGSDINQTLFDSIRENLDDLNDRVTTPVGHISGGIASISSDTEIEMSALYAVDSEGEEVIEVAAQTLDITVGADSITGVIPASYTDLTLHVFAGLKTGESTPQFYLSESISPSGFDYYRHVGSYLCDSSGDLLHGESSGSGDKVIFRYDTYINQSANTGTSFTSNTLPVPSGVSVNPDSTVFMSATNTILDTTTISSGKSTQTSELVIQLGANEYEKEMRLYPTISTDTSKRIYLKVNNTAYNSGEIRTMGYEVNR
jgi:hypothetical protein